MKWGQWLLCGWPGLAQLWLRGSYRSLFVATGFSLLMNVALVATFLWPELLGHVFPAVVWPIIFVLWLGTALLSMRMIEQLAGPPKMSAELDRVNFSSEKDRNDYDALPANQTVENRVDLFIEAQHEYLKGHLAEAESLLQRRLNQEPRDVESRLLLATAMRIDGRPDEAQQQLKLMERFDESVHWKFEIERERELMASILQEEEELEEFGSVSSPESNDIDLAA